MKKAIILLAFLFFACGPTYVMRYVCTCDQQKTVQEFVQSSIKDANNMSDEEMEDVILELYRVGVRTNCDYRKVEIEGPNNVVVTKLDSCQTVASNVW